MIRGVFDPQTSQIDTDLPVEFFLGHLRMNFVVSE